MKSEQINFSKKCDLQMKNQTPGQQDCTSIWRNPMLVWKQYIRQKPFSSRLICMVVVSWPLRASYWANSMDTQVCINTLRLRQKVGHVTDNNFRPIFLNENVRISIKIWELFVPKGPFNNILALVQIMAWRRPGDKPLSEPMMVRLSMHINQPQWVNTCIRWVFFMKHTQKYS